MAEGTITRDELNRATLARQLLLERAELPVAEAVERLGALQAQEAKPPFVALWTRLEGFERGHLAAALHDGSVVRGTLMRATIHLASHPDYAAIRPVLHDTLVESGVKVLKDRSAGLDPESTLARARELLDERPRTFGELRGLLAEAFPDADERALGFTARMGLPLTMVPTDDPWAFPSDAAFSLAETSKPDLALLVRRYLAAFGPATTADAQTYTGIKAVKGAIEAMDDLVIFKDGRRTLYDLPDAPRPPADTPAPPRLLPDFDSLRLAHKDRTRLLDDEHKPRLQTKNLRVLATFLVDGRIAGTWKVERDRVVLDPFAKLPRAAAKALADEGERLIGFLRP